MSTHPPERKYKPFDFSIIRAVEPTSESERTTHQASCHCGAVKFSVTLKWPFPKYPVNQCNCSICVSHGYLLVYPARQDVVFIQGYEDLGEYKFSTKQKTHKFCKKCGSSLLIDLERSADVEIDPAKDMLAVNVRHFDDIDLDTLEYTFVDGKSYTGKV